jgi:hypothetical protein
MEISDAIVELRDGLGRSGSTCQLPVSLSMSCVISFTRPVIHRLPVPHSPIGEVHTRAE